MDVPLPTTLKVILQEDWHPCEATVATLLFRDQDTGYAIPLDDPSGLIFGQLQAVQDDGVYLRKGTPCLVSRPSDATDGHFEIVTAGQFCSSSGSSEGGSSESGSSSSSSGICYPVFGDTNNFPIVDDPDFVIGMKNGCWCLVPVAPCPTTSGSG